MYKKTLFLLLVSLILTACQQPPITSVQVQPEEEGPPLLTTVVQSVIPQELLDLAPGKNAEALVAVNFPDSLSESVTDEDVKTQLQKLKGFVLVTKKDTLKPGLPFVWLGMVFRDEKTAREALDFYEKSRFISPTTKEQFSLEQRQNLLVSGNNNSSRFIGKLSEHPQITKLAGLDPQPVFFAYLNSTQIPELNLTLRSQAPLLIDPLNSPELSTVYSAGTLMAKELTAVGQWQNNQLDLTLTNLLNTDQQILEKLLVSTLFPSNTAQPVTAEQKTFVSSTVKSAMDEYENVYTYGLAPLKIFIDRKNSDFPPLTSTLDIKADRINLTFLVKPAALENFYGLLVTGWTENENKTKNDNKQAILSDVLTALDQYRIQNNRYPENIGCLEDVLELKTFLKDNVIPTDPEGPQTFGNSLCESGFYLEKINADNYNLWAKMEGNNQGNTEWPELNAGKGNFYVIRLEYLPALEEPLPEDFLPEEPLLEEPPPEDQLPAKPKVKRPDAS